ncbi:unnamed protein product [Clavelina lepadiformis]|uniref:Uncharacterized protein n=1 Tax=Clavelina lepadiformis TaxID=159417 RepID=A0ABP0FX43_CLALP
MYEVVDMSPTEIRFMQDSICRNFRRHEGSVNGSINSILRGQMSALDFPKISVIPFKGKYFSEDNRRLYVFRVLHCLGKLDFISVHLRRDYLGDLQYHFKYTTTNEGQSIRVRGDITKPHFQHEVEKPRTARNIAEVRKPLPTELIEMEPVDIRFYADETGKSVWKRFLNDVVKSIADGTLDFYKFLGAINVFYSVCDENGFLYCYSHRNNRKLYVARALQYIGKLDKVKVNVVKWPDSPITTTSDGNFIKVKEIDGAELPHSRSVILMQRRLQLLSI